jgi:putative copper export protein
VSKTITIDWGSVVSPKIQMSIYYTAFGTVVANQMTADGFSAILQVLRHFAQGKMKKNTEIFCS